VCGNQPRRSRSLSSRASRHTACFDIDSLSTTRRHRDHQPGASPPSNRGPTRMKPARYHRRLDHPGFSAVHSTPLRLDSWGLLPRRCRGTMRTRNLTSSRTGIAPTDTISACDRRSLMPSRRYGQPPSERDVLRLTNGQQLHTCRRPLRSRETAHAPPALTTTPLLWIERPYKLSIPPAPVSVKQAGHPQGLPGHLILRRAERHCLQERARSSNTLLHGCRPASRNR
jgi:hypothetical protein